MLPFTSVPTKQEREPRANSRKNEKCRKNPTSSLVIGQFFNIQNTLIGRFSVGNLGYTYKNTYNLPFFTCITKKKLQKLCCFIDNVT